MSRLTTYFNSTLKDKSNIFNFLQLVLGKGQLYIHDPSLLPSYPKIRLSSIAFDGMNSIRKRLWNYYQLFMK